MTASTLASLLPLLAADGLRLARTGEPGWSYVVALDGTRYSFWVTDAPEAA